MFGLYALWVKMFYDLQDNGKCGYMLLISSLLMDVLNKKYIEFIDEGIPEIESLPLEQKTMYWELSKKYYTNKETRIRAAKASYVLTLITSTD